MEETTTIEQPEVTEVVEPVEAPPEDILGAPAVEEPEAPVGAPEAYELAPPEGWDAIDPTLLESAVPVLKELNLTNEQAQKVVALAPSIYDKGRSDVEAAMIAAAGEQKANWAKDAKADPEFKDWNETIQLSAKGLDAMGFNEKHPFRALLSETGFGNHPDMVRVFRALGRMASEGTFVPGSDTKGGGGDVLAEMYPNNRRSK